MQRQGELKAGGQTRVINADDTHAKKWAGCIFVIPPKLQTKLYSNLNCQTLRLFVEAYVYRYGVIVAA